MSESRPSTSAIDYPTIKQIDPIGIRYDKTNRNSSTIAIPIKNIVGDIRSLQFIYVDPLGATRKSNLKGGEIRGNFHPIGELINEQDIFIAEGYATGVSIHMATGKAVAVVFGTMNIASVTTLLRTNYNQSKIIIAADGNAIGKEKATETAQTYECSLVVPQFHRGIPIKSNGKPYDDFNDVHVLFGLQALKDQLTDQDKASMFRSNLQRATDSKSIHQNPCGTFSPNALPPILHDYVTSICETTNADPIMVTISVLTMASAFIGKRRSIPDYFQILYPNIWSIVIASSGQFKTTALRKGAALAFERQKEVFQRIKQLEAERNNSDPDDHLLNKEIAQESLRDVILPDKMTTESLLNLLAREHYGAIFSSEFGLWLQNMAKRFNSDLKGTFTELYDVPSSYRYSTKTQGNHIIIEPYIIDRTLYFNLRSINYLVASIKYDS